MFAYGIDDNKQMIDTSITKNPELKENIFLEIFLNIILISLNLTPYGQSLFYKRLII
jgi:hypothetical protein